MSSTNLKLYNRYIDKAANSTTAHIYYMAANSTTAHYCAHARTLELGSCIISVEPLAEDSCAANLTVMLKLWDFGVVSPCHT